MICFISRTALAMIVVAVIGFGAEPAPVGGYKHGKNHHGH